jgi:high affinity sulfate transporter 1
MTESKPAVLERSRTGEIGALIKRYIPITRWLPGYRRADLRGDLIGGISSWAVMVPVALAYAGLAGMPAQVGLVTAFAALATYALFGTSRHLRVTTSSTMAIMSASVVAPLAAGDATLFLALTASLALIVGALLIAAGLLRFGFLADFLSKPVVTGFVIGLAITIIVGQLPKLLGLPSVSGSILDQLGQMIAALPNANRATAVVGVASLILILALKRIVPRFPGALVALIGGIGLVIAFDLAEKGVAVVGEVSTGVPLPGLPGVAVGQLAYLFTGALGLTVLASGESLGGARAFAARHHYRVDADQELVALGAANLASGMFGGFAVDASLSQTAAGEASGSRTQLSSLVIAGLMLATAISLVPLFRDLPQATLAAVVIGAVISLIDLQELRRYYAWRRTDLLIALVALVGVVTTDVLTGLIIAAALSLAALLYRASRPDVVVIGRLPGIKTYGDVSRHPDARQIPQALLLRIDTPLYFFNAQEASEQILRLADAHPDVHVVVLDMSATNDLDVTATDLLAETFDELQRRHMQLLLVKVKGIVRDRLRRTGLMDVLGEEHIYSSMTAAVDAIEAAP